MQTKRQRRRARFHRCQPSSSINKAKKCMNSVAQTPNKYGPELRNIKSNLLTPPHNPWWLGGGGGDNDSGGDPGAEGTAGERKKREVLKETEVFQLGDLVRLEDNDGLMGSTLMTKLSTN